MVTKAIWNPHTKKPAASSRKLEWPKADQSVSAMEGCGPVCAWRAGAGALKGSDSGMIRSTSMATSMSAVFQP